MSPATSKPVVVVADDDPDILKLVKFAVERQGCTAVGVEDGDEAFRQIYAAPPALAILDVRMPHLTGMEVLRV